MLIQNRKTKFNSLTPFCWGEFTWRECKPFEVNQNTRWYANNLDIDRDYDAIAQIIEKDISHLKEYEINRKF